MPEVNNNSVSPVLPYWRLSSFYFFYFCVVGALIPYWGLYLQSLGYSAKDIGIISAIILATRILAPNFWGWLADRTQQRLRIIRVGSFIACISFSGVFVGEKFFWLVAVISSYSFFWHAVLPQFEVITLTYLDKNHQKYGLIRLWGSLGFMVAVVLLGLIFGVLDIDYLPIFILTFLLLIWLSSLSLKPVEVASRGPSALGFWRLVTRPTILCFLFASFLLQLSHGPYYTFYSIYLIDHYGYSSKATGLLWALGVLAEVLIFLVMHKLMGRFTLRALLLWSLLLTSTRWVLIALWAESLSVLLFAQLLHAFSFGVIHAVSIEIVRVYFGGQHQGQGQALYSALSFGAGGALGALLGGFVWDYSAGLSFIFCAGAALMAYLIVWWGVFPQLRNDSASDNSAVSN